MKFDVKRWLRDFPSTNGRIVVTLFMGVLTCLRVLATGLELGSFTVGTVDEGMLAVWCGYLVAQGGWDFAQFRTKRATTFQGAPGLGRPEAQDS